MLFSWELITASPLETVIFLVCVFLAGIIRGAIGFAFSALVIATTSLFVSPALVVPLLILLEIAASSHMLFGVWKDTLWNTTIYMSLGALIATPLGVYILSIAPEDILRLIIANIIFVMTMLFLRGFVYRGKLTNPLLVMVGCLSGVLNGMAGVGGLFVAVFLASLSLPIRSVRATLVVFFLAAEIIFLVSASAADIYNARIFNTFLVACIPMILGIILGTKLFHYLDEKKLRRLVLFMLIGLSILGLGRAIYGFIMP